MKIAAAALAFALVAAAASAGSAQGPLPKAITPRLPAWDIGAKWPGVPMLLDQYGTYRTQHIGQYLVTQPVPGLRAYGEFEPAGQMILAWDVGYFDDLFLQMIKPVYQTTTVLLLHDGATAKTDIVNALKGAGIAAADVNDPAKFLFVNAPLDAFWTRDYGPIPAVDAAGSYVAIDFQYYWERVRDDGSTAAVAQALDVAVARPDLKFEGGNFMTNGRGLCMATKGAVWNNLPLQEKEATKIFRDYLGCEKMVYLTPLAGEGTTHIDMYAKIMDETTVIVGKYDYQQDCVNGMLLDENAALLEGTTTVDGKPLRVLRIPMPNNADGVWRTYTNSLLVNRVALIPVYANDRAYEPAALDVYAQALPGWTLVPIDSDGIIPDGGAMHCITMTTPKPPSQKLADPAALCGATSYTCATVGCGTITAEGLCDGNVNIWCENGLPQSYDCATPCSMIYGGYPCEQKCGIKTGTTYDCMAKLTCQCADECAQGDTGCTADGLASWACTYDNAGGCWRRDPTACTAGKACVGGDCSCTPDCAGKTCGDDNGCGHWCTDCPVAGDRCDPVDWTCKLDCIPDCTGKECGPDGCAGLCGQCQANASCGQGRKCVADPADDAGTPDDGGGATDGSVTTDAGKADAGGTTDAGAPDSGRPIEKDAGAGGEMTGTTDATGDPAAGCSCATVGI